MNQQENLRKYGIIQVLSPFGKEEERQLIEEVLDDKIFEELDLWRKESLNSKFIFDKYNHNL